MSIRLFFIFMFVHCVLFGLVPASAEESIPAPAELSKTEQAYVRQHPQITIAIDLSWQPYALTDRAHPGQVSGAIPQILNLVCKNTGLKVKYLAKNSFAEVLDAVHSGEADMLVLAADDPETVKKKQVQLTHPFMQIFYSALSHQQLSGIYSLTGGAKIAVCSDSAIVHTFRRQMPKYEFVSFPSNQSCLNAVLTDKVQMALIEDDAAKYYLAQSNYTPLYSVLLHNFSCGLCFALPDKADPQLITILNKGIDSLTLADKNDALTRSLWKNESLTNLIARYPMYSLLLAIIVLITAFLLGSWHNQQLKVTALKQIHADNQKLAVTARQAEEAAAKAKQASRAKSTFLSNMSHEIRTPLNAIIGLTHLALDSNRQKTMAQTHNYLNNIYISSKYLLSILNDILDMSSIENGKFTLSPHWIPLRKVVESSITTMQSLFDEKEITFTCQGLEHLSLGQEAYVDSLRLQQVFINLLNNAYKFTDVGGRISLEITNISQEKDRRIDQFVITDNGCGMSEKFLQHLYEPFLQEKNVHSGLVNGTGLGMSLVKKIIDLMQGTIQVKSRLNEGTAFTVQIPSPVRAAVCELPLTTDPNQDKVVDLRGLNVLLAEDHPLNTLISRRLLEKVGIHVTNVINGADAVRVFKEAPAHYFQIILMDIRMPKMNGWEASQAIRHLQRSDADSVVIIAMTANATEDDIKASKEAGMNYHLSKPIEPVQLYQVLQRYYHPEVN